MNYGKALRLARALAGLQQQQLADKAGIDASYISLIEQGKRSPSVKFIHKISKAIGIPPYLFTFLAMESDDTELLDEKELASLGEALTKLVLNYGTNPTDEAKSRKNKPDRAA
jgi:transcriptional regulator with XRE-family HTH domain